VRFIFMPYSHDSHTLTGRRTCGRVATRPPD